MKDVSAMTTDELNRHVAKLVDGCWHEWNDSDKQLDEGYPIWRCKHCKEKSAGAATIQDFCDNWAAFGRAWEWCSEHKLTPAMHESFPDDDGVCSKEGMV